jgi:NAD(P)-dependent dehydrogenase (short-subunit alcohol dehydrogenase family)
MAGVGSLSARSAIVTGAASGIGRATARTLASQGRHVCLVDLAPMEDVVAEISALGVSAVAVQGNAGERSTMDRAVDSASRIGALDTAVFNAGVLTAQGDITRLDDALYNKVIAANINGAVRGLAAFIRGVGSSPARAVVTASSVGLVPAPHDPVYAMTKHAVVGLVRSLALNNSLANIRINCICPNGVDTPMLNDDLKAGRQLLSPTDVATRIAEILEDPRTGQAWVCTPTIFTPFEFPPNPGYTFPSFDGAGTTA